jgi:undecaprenyl diphosphate synthase
MPQQNNSPFPEGTIIPNHIAIILDGNGRWARSHGLPVTKGHEAGTKAIKEVMNAARKWGVHTLTIWGFSTENWSRPYWEIKKIMSLVKMTLQSELNTAIRDGVKFHHIGRKDRLPKDLLTWINKFEEETKENDKYILNVALDYGGHDEILRAVKKIVEAKIPANDIDEGLFERYLDTADQPYPYPDLFIRTSGEQRSSGFLPWQMAYTEFYFEPDHLPDMTADKLKAAIIDFSRRRRRFGAKDKVIHFKFRPEVTAGLEIAWWRLNKIPAGIRLRDYAMEHIREQFGISKYLAKEASVLLSKAIVDREEEKWEEAKIPLKKFYVLLKEELKLAFEPSIAASLEIKLWQDINNKESIEKAIDVEETARQYYAEVYRISLFQAAKVAHLRVLANVEKNLAENGYGEEHWDRAENYLQKFYSALKERVA